MERLVVNTGLKEYEVENELGEILGVLRFNPTDQNLYARFVDLYSEIPELSKQYEETINRFAPKADEAEGLETDEELESEEDTEEEGLPEGTEEIAVAVKEFDTDIKDRMSYVFGRGNDFNAMLSGVSVLALNDTGSSALENLLDTLLPVIVTSSETRQNLMLEKAKAAKEQADLNREQRRRKKK